MKKLGSSAPKSTRPERGLAGDLAPAARSSGARGIGRGRALHRRRSISPASELRGLLSLAPKAARHFQPITERVATRSPPAAARERGRRLIGRRPRCAITHTLQLGLFAAQKSPDSWQLIDCVYYPSDTYFMALDLFQLWPVDGGTLVWQVGFVSAPFRSYLGGIDRYVAGKMMTQATLATIKAFRADLEQKP